MKRKAEEMEDGAGPPPPIRTYIVPPPPTYINSSIPPPNFINSSVPPPQNFINRGRGVWQPRVPQGSMRGVAFHGVVRPYFRGPRMPASNRGFFRGRGRAEPIRYNSYENYDNSYQEFVPLPPWTDPHGYQPEQQTQNYYQKPVWNPQQHQQQPPFQQHALQQHNENALEQESENTAAAGDETYTKTKAGKRRPMSQSYPSRPWNKEDAERALREETLQMRGLRNQSLIIRFPDPELSKDIVKSFHPAIDNVHFQVPSGARYCFVQLTDTVNPDKTIKELEQIKFGSGKLTVEKKFTKDELSPEAIDPYTLYIGNLPTNVNVASVKEKFPTATRIDIGFAQRMKFTRYAFIRYNTVDEAIEAYRETHNLVLDTRSIIVRFRRQRGHVGLPGESIPQNPPKNVEKVPKVKVKKEKMEKPKEIIKKEKKEVIKDEEDEDDEEDDEVDDDDDEEDDDDDDDDDEDEDAEEDDEDDEDEDEADVVDVDDDPDDDEEDDDDDENEDQSGNLLQQIDSQIVDLDGINLNYMRK